MQLLKRNILVIFTALFSVANISALDFYWVNGAGDWSDINHWATTSGGNIVQAVVPSQNDNVFF